MGINIAVAGKGGTGKTTLCGLIIRGLIEGGKHPVLALDADSNSNLNQVLGVDSINTVGMLREQFKKEAPRMDKGMYKDQVVEMNLQQALAENDKFDLLVMGRGEGPGCYCYANNLFRKYIDILQDNYSYVVMDNEAGMEHLSRRTTQGIDYLVIVSDPSPRGIMTAARIRDLAGQLELKASEELLVVNRVNGDLDPRLIKQVEDSSLKLAAVIGQDEEIMDMDISGQSIFDLSKDNLPLKQVRSLLEQLPIFSK
ncbi:MAG: AAA family ATPase [Actinomycetia bacterium]|nr:AAA family ATPase [Actinomycetes bacterium]